LVKELLLEILLINPENSKEEYSQLNKINNPYELLNFKSKINNFGFYIKLLKGKNYLNEVDKKFDKGKEINKVTNALKEIIYKVIDHVINGKIIMQFLVYQRLLECLKFFPEEETGLFKISSFEMGKGVIKEMKTSKAFKQKFMTLKSNSKKSTKTRKNRKTLS
jgi:hypothetical protein